MIQRFDTVITPADRIIQAKIFLNTKNPFFSYILMNFRIEQNNTVVTMGVNRYGYLLWNEDFVKNLKFKELCGVLCHEVGHIALQTFERLGSRNMILWNMATDLSINWIIMQYDYLSLPKAALLPDKNGIFNVTLTSNNEQKKLSIIVKNKTSEEIYDQLETNVKEFVEYVKNTPQFDKHFYNNTNGENGITVKDGDSCCDIEHNNSSEDINKNAKNWEKKITEAATVSKQQGHLLGDIERYVNDMLNPQINWKKKLMAFLTKEFPVNYTMCRPGRRFYTTNIYYPTLLRESLTVNVGIDCSGSISQNEYNEFIAEVISIARGFDSVKMFVQYWDTEVRGELEVINGNIEKIRNYKIPGGGGTVFNSWCEYLANKGKKTNVYICLTDGYIEDTKIKHPLTGPLIFVLSANGSPDIIKKYGEVTKLNRN